MTPFSGTRVSVPSSKLGPSQCPPHGNKGGTHSPSGEGVRGPNSDDWRKKPSTLSTLWSSYYTGRRKSKRELRLLLASGEKRTLEPFLTKGPRAWFSFNPLIFLKLEIQYLCLDLSMHGPSKLQSIS